MLSSFWACTAAIRFSTCCRADLILSPYRSAPFGPVRASVPCWGKKFPHTARCGVQIKEVQTSVFPLNNYGEPTCVAACRLVFVMHVWRSTARTLRSFPRTFLRGSGWNAQWFLYIWLPPPLPLPATKCYPSQKPKQHMYRITNLSHGSTSFSLVRKVLALAARLGLKICEICISVLCE